MFVEKREKPRQTGGGQVESTKMEEHTRRKPKTRAAGPLKYFYLIVVKLGARSLDEPVMTKERSPSNMKNDQHVD